MKHYRSLLILVCALMCSLFLTVPADAAEYTVVKGDCLWKIAKSHLGNGCRWGEIYDVNRDSIRNPDLIYIDQVISVPEEATALVPLTEGVATETQAAPLPVVSAPLAVQPSGITAADYANAANWSVIPKITKQADTFYLYPTVYTDNSQGAPDISSLEDEALRIAADNNVKTTCDIFSESTNVFVPYYRQSNLAAIASLDNDELLAFQKHEQRDDVYAALDYYFEHYNEGRPFFLAGHGQGALMIRLVLREYMSEHPDYLKRMVAAYAPGCTFTEEDFKANPSLRFAEGESDTGVVISWNTEGEGNTDNFCVKDGALCINPLNWKTDGTYASADVNLGSRFVDRFSGAVSESSPSVADARVDPARGVVITSGGDYPYTKVSTSEISNLYGERSFHKCDFLFYYKNIQQNVALRLSEFLSLT